MTNLLVSLKNTKISPKKFVLCFESLPELPGRYKNIHFSSWIKLIYLPRMALLIFTKIMVSVISLPFLILNSANWNQKLLSEGGSSQNLFKILLRKIYNSQATDFKFHYSALRFFPQSFSPLCLELCWLTQYLLQLHFISLEFFSSPTQIEHLILSFLFPFFSLVSSGLLNSCKICPSDLLTRLA